MKQFKTESKRILDLMVNSIYTNKDIFLRELISNASDAIDKLKFISLTDEKARADFKISLSIDKENRKIIIEDNGIGMTDKELEKNLGTIAESGTLAFKKENAKDGEELIGQFGVGFYSAFMVADKIEVYTKAYGSDKAYKFESVGAEGYEIEECEKQGFGTKIVLSIKEDKDEVNYSNYLSQYTVANLVKQYSDYIRYPITLEMTEQKLKEGTEKNPEYEEVKEIKTLNSMVPVWKKPKAEVKEEDLNDFYKSEFHEISNPVKSVYAKIEGAVNYDALLFFPSKVPFGYYSKDYKKGLKLYCNGVMIMERCEELLPDCFGFVRGIVDSPDLNLNISREILQQDRQVKAIANGIEKKIIAELKKLMEEDIDSYRKIFNEFGLSIKFGVYENFGMNKDKLKDLLMFYSQNNEKLITLSEYVKAMKEGQNEIYYACGESFEVISSLPQIEKAKDLGYDILYFKDNVDEFVAKILVDFEGKKFKSVSEADFSLSSEEEKEQLKKDAEDYKDLLNKIGEILKDGVKEVRLTSNLKTYPACLISAGELSIEMEKVLNAMPSQTEKVKADKILEISANHPVLAKLKNLYETDEEGLKKYCTVLYEQARLLEGLPLDNVSAFVKALNEII